jgi:hypothetical protein
VTEWGGLRLTLLDLLVIAGMAVASFWAGQAITALYASKIIGEPVPDVAFQIQYGVLADKDSITSLEDQQRIVSYQVALTRTLLDAEQIDLARASGARATSLAVQVSESSALLDKLKARQMELSESLDSKHRALAKAEYHAQKRATRSSSLRRLGVWVTQAVASLIVFAGLAIVLLMGRLGIRYGLHSRAALCGALVVLGGLLFAAYAGWVGLMLVVILVLFILVIGGRHGNVRAR